MNQKKILISLLFIGATQVNAQETTTTSGGNASGTNGSLSYTIGQTVYTTISGTTGSMAQGVQQAFEIQTVLGTENFNINLQMSVFPNPTTNWFQLDIKNYDFEKLSYQILDINGKLIMQSKISSETTAITTENMSTNLYFLKVLDNNKELKTFKIIKK